MLPQQSIFNFNNLSHNIFIYRLHPVYIPIPHNRFQKQTLHTSHCQNTFVTLHAELWYWMKQIQNLLIYRYLEKEPALPVLAGALVNELARVDCECYEAHGGGDGVHEMIPSVDQMAPTPEGHQKRKNQYTHVWSLIFTAVDLTIQAHKMWQCRTGQAASVFQMITASSTPGSSRTRTFTEWLHKQVLITHAGASEDQNGKINATQFYIYSTL